MTDIVSPATRSRMMSRIRGKDTVPERTVRSLLHDQGFRFQLHRGDLPGRPDLVLPKHAAAATNRRFWKAKLRLNRERDQRNLRMLRDAGWRVLVVWECAIRDRPDTKALDRRLGRWIRSAARLGEIP
jgi:DNA mismatch endonuclease (patch repair protein)